MALRVCTSTGESLFQVSRFSNNVLRRIFSSTTALSPLRANKQRGRSPVGSSSLMSVDGRIPCFVLQLASLRIRSLRGRLQAVPGRLAGTNGLGGGHGGSLSRPMLKYQEGRHVYV